MHNRAWVQKSSNYKYNYFLANYKGSIYAVCLVKVVYQGLWSHHGRFSLFGSYPTCCVASLRAGPVVKQVSNRHYRKLYKPEFPVDFPESISFNSFISTAWSSYAFWNDNQCYEMTTSVLKCQPVLWNANKLLLQGASIFLLKRVLRGPLTATNIFIRVCIFISIA